MEKVQHPFPRLIKWAHSQVNKVRALLGKPAWDFSIPSRKVRHFYVSKPLVRQKVIKPQDWIIDFTGEILRMIPVDEITLEELKRRYPMKKANNDFQQQVHQEAASVKPSHVRKVPKASTRSRQNSLSSV